MGRIEVSRRKSRRPQIGDMRARITINTRSITEPDFNEEEFDQTYTLVDTIWASIVETPKGKRTFAGVQLDEDITEIFVIRYRSDITSENVIGLDGSYYKILKALDPEKRKQWLWLLCKERGTTTKKANW